MSRRSNVLTLAASLAGMIAAGTLAMAQGSSTEQRPSPAEARLAWAKRHVELVCRPLEVQKLFDKATRCYNDVARLVESSLQEATAGSVGDTSPAGALPEVAKAPGDTVPAPAVSAPAKARPATRPAPVRTAAVQAAPRVVAPRAPARIVVAQAERAPTAAAAQLASSRCSGMSCFRYTLLGVGF